MLPLLPGLLDCSLITCVSILVQSSPVFICILSLPGMTTKPFQFGQFFNHRQHIYKFCHCYKPPNVGTKTHVSVSQQLIAFFGEYQDVRKGHGLDDEGGGEVGLQGLNAECLSSISPKAFSLSSLPSPSYNCLQLFCHQAQLHTCNIPISL